VSASRAKFRIGKGMTNEGPEVGGRMPDYRSSAAPNKKGRTVVLPFLRD
jgi:hypothetical protein